ncbi:MAG TPA: hypothetical protein VIO33_02600, partial [Burkholderiaceae bacterium]
MDIDFDSLAQQALAPPATAPTPTGRVVPFPGTPASAGPDYDSLAGTVMDLQRATAAQNLVAAQASDPDRAAKALQVSRATGIPQPAAEANLDQAQQAATLTKNMQTLEANPALSSFVAANPLAARMAQDDFDKLSFVERMTTALKSGAATALLANQLGRAGNEKQAAAALGIDTPALDARVGRLQSSINAQPKLTGGMGVAQGISGLLAGLVDNAIEGGSQGALVGAGIGAAGGAAFGGIGAAPGAAAGAATGGLVGFNVDMSRVAAGNAYLKMSQIRGADGQPLSEAGKQFGAITTGVLTYLIGTYASKIESKVLGETAESLAQQAVQRAVQMPTFARAAADFGIGTLKGAGQGAGIMTAMEASSILGEELAKTVTSGDFARDPHEMVERLADAALNGAVTLGAMHGAMKGLALYGDARSAVRAQGQAEMLRNLMAGAEGTKLRERDLQSFQAFMQQQTDGSPIEHLYLPADTVRELYQGARIDPAALADRTKDPLFGFVADMPQQLREAAASGGDVVIPTADFVTHLAGTPLAERLLPDLRVGADAMSLNEAKQFQAEYEARLKSAVEEASKTEPSSIQRIEDEVRQQAVEAGYRDVVASRYAKLYAARYATRAERLGLDPYEAYKQAGIRIQKGEGTPSEGSRELSQSGTIGPEGAPHEEAGHQRAAGEQAHEDVLPTVGGGNSAQGWAGATRIRGADDRPATSYRGSALELAPEHFDLKALGQASARPSSGLGVWFTPDKGEAKTYGDVESFHLDVRNPKVIKVEDLPGFDSVEDAHAYREKLRKQGYDGIIVTAKHLGGPTHVVAFHPDQVIYPKPEIPDTFEVGGEYNQGERGKISFNNGRAVISLFEKADASTLIHESGHAWLEELSS